MFSYCEALVILWILHCNSKSGSIIFRKSEKVFFRYKNLGIYIFSDSASSSGTNSIEMYNAPTITEDSKSYSTYGRRSVNDFPDEFKPYEVSSV